MDPEETREVDTFTQSKYAFKNKWHYPIKKNQMMARACMTNYWRIPLEPVSCHFQHPWTQHCSVFKRALSLAAHPRGTHASSLCSCTVDPINWLPNKSVLWTVKARPIFLRTASTCRSVLWATVVIAAQKFGVDRCMKRAAAVSTQHYHVHVHVCHQSRVNLRLL